MNCEYARKAYGVPACIGRRVIAYGQPGIIAEDRGHYIGIRVGRPHISSGLMAHDFKALTSEINETLREEIPRLASEEYIVTNIETAKMLFFLDGTPWITPEGFEEVPYAGN